MTTEKARAILEELAVLFQDPERLVGGMAATFIRGGDRPIDRWSWGNRLIAWLHGTADARTFLQWKSTGRSVRKGAEAFCILAPCTREVVERDEDGEEVTRAKLRGFRAVAVFRIEDTDGEPIPSYEPTVPPPLSDLPARWGISVTYRPILGEGFPIMGAFSPGEKRITLFTENEATFFHELLHAADDRLAPLHGGQEADQEAVAELGAAVLARLYGGRIDRAAWEYVRIYHESPAEAVRRLLPRVEGCLNLILADAGGGAE